MPLSPDIAPQVVATCRENAGQLAAAMSQVFELPLQVDPQRIEAFAYENVLPEWNGPGLLVVLNIGGEVALVLLAAAGGLLPEGLRTADPRNEPRLEKLAAQLGKHLLPAEHSVTSSQARYVEHLGQAVTGSAAAGAGAVRCMLASGDKTATMHLLWPATLPKAVLGEDDAGNAASSSDLALHRKAALADEDIAERMRSLPSYARSLLRISVPVSVHLASIKQPVSRVLNIGPGTIIQFEKNCEQPLTLCVGSQPLAEGEAVKVGEKFGIKLTQMILPGERFFALRGAK